MNSMDARSELRWIIEKNPDDLFPKLKMPLKVLRRLIDGAERIVDMGIGLAWLYYGDDILEIHYGGSFPFCNYNFYKQNEQDEQGYKVIEFRNKKFKIDWKNAQKIKPLLMEKQV